MGRTQGTASLPGRGTAAAPIMGVARGLERQVPDPLLQAALPESPSQGPSPLSCHSRASAPTYLCSAVSLGSTSSSCDSEEWEETGAKPRLGFLLLLFLLFGFFGRASGHVGS